MAIDDNADYTLTGAQVKDLASEINAKADSSSLAAVATSGSYVDLNNKPTITDPVTYYLNSAEIGDSPIVIYEDSGFTTIANPVDVCDAVSSGAVVQIVSNNPDAATATITSVVTSPEYFIYGQTGDSTFKYRYFSAQQRWAGNTTKINNATLTIQHNGTDVQTFTANQSTNVTANIETIYADTIAPATSVNPVTADMIDWSTIQDVNITKVNANISWDGYTYCKRFGNIIFVNFNIATSSAISGSSVLYSGLPVPSKVVCFSIASDDNKAYRATINTNGELCADGAIAGGGWFDGQAFYFV